MWFALLARRNPKVIPRSVSVTDAWGGAGGGADMGSKASKRTLKRDSHDTLMLLTPFMMWSCLVFIFYSVSVAQLKVRLGRRGCRGVPGTAHGAVALFQKVPVMCMAQCGRYGS